MAPLKGADGQVLGYAWAGLVENWHRRAFAIAQAYYGGRQFDCAAAGAEVAKKTFRRGHRHGQERDHDQWHAPDRQCPAPGIFDERQHIRDRQHHCQSLTDEETVGVERGSEAHSLGQPLPNQRRQRRLHDCDARAHHDGRAIEDEHVKHSAA